MMVLLGLKLSPNLYLHTLWSAEFRAGSAEAPQRIGWGTTNTAPGQLRTSKGSQITVSSLQSSSHTLFHLVLSKAVNRS